jgi:predicted nucleic acid-binding protein
VAKRGGAADTLYVESSALLRVLLEGDAMLSEEVARYARLFTSALTLIEVPRSLRRALRDGRIDVAGHANAHRRYAGFVQATMVAEITKQVRERAALDFPVEPVRSLDAIHLATILEWNDAVAPMTVASCDDRIRQNAVSLGYDVVP